jgi:hypothetical protein
MSKKTSQLKVAKAQRKVVDAFVKNHSDIISALPNEAVDGFSLGVSGALGVQHTLCISSINLVRLA